MLYGVGTQPILVLSLTGLFRENAGTLVLVNVERTERTSILNRSVYPHLESTDWEVGRGLGPNHFATIIRALLPRVCCKDAHASPWEHFGRRRYLQGEA